VERAFGTGRESQVEFPAGPKGGPFRLFQCNFAPLKVGDVTSELLVVATDVTDLKTALEEKAKAADREAEIRRLAELSEFRSRFIGAASHELNTPLTPMAIQLEILQSQPERTSSPKHAKALEILARNFSRLRALVRDLLEGAMLETGDLRLARSELDLRDLVERSASAAARDADRKRVRLEVSVPETCSLRGDDSRLGKALASAIQRAIRVTPEGRDVCVTTRVEESQAIIRVRDAGSGLSEGERNHVFDAFLDVPDAGAAPSTDSGLALYIGRFVVELHGGRIWVERSSPVDGTTLAIALPLRRGHAADAGVTRFSGAASAATSPGPALSSATHPSDVGAADSSEAP
jgi:K+-sensing histidine kinase KdpD